MGTHSLVGVEVPVVPFIMRNFRHRLHSFRLPRSGKTLYSGWSDKRQVASKFRLSEYLSYSTKYEKFKLCCDVDVDIIAAPISVDIARELSISA